MSIEIYINLPSFIKRTLDNSKEFILLLRNFFITILSIKWTNISTTTHLGDYINIFGIALYYIPTFTVIIIYF
jgi:hypothetical protein